MKRFAVGALVAALMCSIIANVLLYMRYSSNRPLITIGDMVITRKDYREALERNHGKPVLRKLVLARLVEREARVKGVAPSESDVDARLKRMESTAPAMLRSAREDSMKLYLLRSDVYTDLALERLRTSDVKVSEAEIAAYHKKNPGMFMRPMRVNATSVVAGNESDAATAAKLLKQDMKPFVIAQQPRLSVVGVRGFQVNLNGLTPDESTRLHATMGRMRPGEVATVKLKDQYLIFRVRSQEKMEVVPLEAARDEVTELAKLAKAPDPAEVLVRLYQKSHPVFEMNIQAEYFREYEEARLTPEKKTSAKTSGTQTASR